MPSSGAWAALPTGGSAAGNGSGHGSTGDDDGATDLGDFDCVLLAAGVLGDQEHLEDDPAAAADLAVANYAGPVSTLLHVTRRLEEQGHGTIIVLSSVSAERVRQSNFVYGSSKAALDGFSQGLGDSLEGTGVNVMVVRPGFVHSSMTEGMEAPPLSTTPEAVADAVVDALASGKHTVWVPGTFRFVMSAFRHLPRPLWRRLSSRM